MMTEKMILVFDARGNGDGGVSPTITGDHQNRITDYTAIVLELDDEDSSGVRPLQPDNGWGDINDAHGRADGLPPYAVCIGVGR